MRKLLSAMVVLVLLAGAALAAEVTIVKYSKDKKEVLVKEGDMEVTYTVSAKTKVTMVDKDGKDTAGKWEDFEARLLKLPKGGIKVEITSEKEAITEIKIKAGKK